MRSTSCISASYSASESPWASCSSSSRRRRRRACEWMKDRQAPSRGSSAAGVGAMVGTGVAMASSYRIATVVDNATTSAYGCAVNYTAVHPPPLGLGGPHTNDRHDLEHRPRAHGRPVLRQAHDGDHRPRQVHAPSRARSPSTRRTRPTRPASSPIGVASLNTGVEQRDGHLRSADFFDADNHPTATFTATTVESKGGCDYRRRAATSPSAARPAPSRSTSSCSGSTPGMDGARRAGFHATGRINREDFGLTWNVALESGGWLVGKDIKLELDLAVELAKPAAVTARTAPARHRRRRRLTRRRLSRRVPALRSPPRSTARTRPCPSSTSRRCAPAFPPCPSSRTACPSRCSTVRAGPRSRTPSSRRLPPTTGRRTRTTTARS